MPCTNTIAWSPILTPEKFPSWEMFMGTVSKRDTRSSAIEWGETAFVGIEMWKNLRTFKLLSMHLENGSIQSLLCIHARSVDWFYESNKHDKKKQILKQRRSHARNEGDLWYSLITSLDSGVNASLWRYADGHSKRNVVIAAEERTESSQSNLLLRRLIDSSLMR